MELLIENKGTIYDVTELVKSISFTDKLNDGCSKLEFSCLRDGLKIGNGDIVRFIQQDLKFYGIVFKVETDETGITTVTAYDKLRYAKGKDYLNSKGYTISSLVKKMCNIFRLQPGNVAESSYVLKTQPFDGQTWLDILYSSINELLTNTGKWYSLRDECGSIALIDIEDLKLDLILGDESLCYGYSHSISIDDNFYNKIIILMKSDANYQFIIKGDNTSIAKFGTMQYYESIENSNTAQANAKADVLLSLYNREYETLTLKCLGDTKVRAGSSFYVRISEINIDKRLIVKSATHEFLPIHKMTLEVAI